MVISIPIQLALFFAIRNANINTARANIDEALKVTSEIFFNALSLRRDSLLDKVRALSSDYAFKPVANTNEHQSVLSALTSYQARLDADIMLLLTIDGSIIADTKHPLFKGQDFYLPELIEQASNNEYGEADVIDFVDQTPYILVAVPLFSPEPSHWIVMGFLITDEFATALQKTTKSHVSILYGSSKTTWQQLASTLPNTLRRASEQALLSQPWKFDRNIDLSINDQRLVSVALPIKTKKDRHFIVLLQRSLDQALAPYRQLHLLVVVVFFLALMLLIAGGVFIARRITKPVTVLTEGADHIEQGFYDVEISVDQQDELGQLADRFNSMAKGLAERAKVHSILGKVVSPAIAEQLLSSGIELGGEERQATILFSDIRNFTSMCEKQSAKDIIIVLNKLLTRFSGLIDSHQGVVDKYIGDAVMALFGLPINDHNQAKNAVLAALDIVQELPKVNQELAQMAMPLLGLGIGINTATVVAGNMGSETRLNYTVIGDGVNLSARLEGLTKFYGVSILLSETTKLLCPEFTFRKIDIVRVKGKSQGTSIYQPLGLTNELAESTLLEVATFRQVFSYYQQQQWQSAKDLLQQLMNEYPAQYIYQLYWERLKIIESQMVSPSWDGIFTHQKK